ncbi:hypothetical protein [Chryseobacterium sp. CT-SW4]|uniref:hypothetical protein n=1 Tax=Chryseobacterium sp. SW-1 TaxID=3157343 RepID=UPI003B019F18
MNKKVLAILFSAFATSMAFSQVGVNTQVPKTTLDIVGNPAETSVSDGIIAPRLTGDQLIAKDSAYGTDQNGAIVFVTEVPLTTSPKTVDVTQIGYFFYDAIAAKWKLWATIDQLQNAISEVPTEPWNSVSTNLGADSNTQNIYQMAQVGVNTKTPDATAQLDIYSGDKGLLIPRLSKIQRDAITTPAQSLLIWNSDEGCFNFWKTDKWKSMCGDTGQAELKITAADCAAGTVNGTYTEGSSVNSGNYISLTVQVIEPGTYQISGDSGNGFFFQTSGTFATAGTYTLNIPAVGTPSAAGTFNVPLTVNGELFDPGCTKQVTVAPAAQQFEFDNSYCGTNAYSDALQQGVSTAGKTIQIKINVVNPGVFSFESNTVYGVKYTASNLNLTAGSHVVTLTSSGNAPTGSGNNTPFSISGTGMSGIACEVLVNIAPAATDFTLSCSGASVQGTFYSGVATTTANTITVPVTVSQAGPWTASTNTVNGISFSGSGTFAGTGTYNMVLYATGTPTSGGTNAYTITTSAATTATCNVNVTTVYQKKSILIVSGMGCQGCVVSALNNAANFGPNGKVPIEGYTIQQVGNQSATSLQNLINNNGVEIIIAGWDADWSADAAAVIADFIKNKKGFYFQVSSQDQNDNANYLLNPLNWAYGASLAWNANGDDYAIRAAKLSTADNPYLNGPFGDARGMFYITDDNASWLGFNPSTLPANFGGLVQLPANGGQNERTTLAYAPGFFMFPDWGTTLGNNWNGTYSPIGFSTANFTAGSMYNGTGIVTANVPSGQGADWILFGNAMSVAIDYVEKNINKTYLVDTNYAN